MSNDVHKSRRDFIRALGTYQEIADRYGCASRQVIENMVRAGFTIKFKDRLIKDAVERGIAVHPELLMCPQQPAKWYSTPIGGFLHSIAQKYDGFEGLSKETGIPISSIRIMCSKKGMIMEKHASVLEKCARENSIAVPWNIRSNS